MDHENTYHADHLGRCLQGVRLFAPAKLNLGLRITGQRPDGYHTLESLFWPLDLGDELFVKGASVSHVSVDFAEIIRGTSITIPEEENLAFRALSALGISADVTIKKRIPIGSGLGGGSSNAGSLVRHFLPSSKVERLSYAQDLGADVPFFLDPRPSWVTGIGEKIKAVSVSQELQDSLTFLLVFPPFGLSTAEVFKARAGDPFSLPTAPPDLGSRAGLQHYINRVGNDLERAAIRLEPRVEQVLQALRGSEALYAGMSGSGSTCFGVWDQPLKEIPKELVQFFRNQDCRSVIAKTYTENAINN